METQRGDRFPTWAQMWGAFEWRSHYGGTLSHRLSLRRGSLQRRPPCPAMLEVARLSPIVGASHHGHAQRSPVPVLSLLCS